MRKFSVSRLSVFHWIPISTHMLNLLLFIFFHSLHPSQVSICVSSLFIHSTFLPKPLKNLICIQLLFVKRYISPSLHHAFASRKWSWFGCCWKDWIFCSLFQVMCNALFLKALKSWSFLVVIFLLKFALNVTFVSHHFRGGLFCFVFVIF